MSASDIDEAFGSRYENPRFTDAFKKIQGIFSDGSRQGAGGSGEFSLGDLDVAIDIADELLYSNEALDAINGNWDLFGQRLSPSAQSSILDAIGRMRAIRKEMAKLRDQYESDPFIRQSPSRVVPMARPSEPARPARRQQLQNINPIDEVEKYLSARYSSPISARSGRTDNSSAKEGRAEIRAEATKFKELLDSLDIEINKASDPQLSRALTKLKETIRRQKSALLSDKRTNAGALFLTQAELDDIIEALYMALDRQVERGSETRSRLFADFAELMARAAMATFVDKTIEPINSRKVTRLNEAGEEVEIVLYE